MSTSTNTASFENSQLSEKDKKEAIETLNRIKDNPDWIFVVNKLVQSDIDEITVKLLDPNYLWQDTVQEQEAKRTRCFLEEFKKYPEKIIEALKTPDQDDPDLDPYAKNVS